MWENNFGCKGHTTNKLAGIDRQLEMNWLVYQTDERVGDCKSNGGTEGRDKLSLAYYFLN